MPVLNLSKREDLTVEKVLKIFENEFSKKYKVYATKLIGADFVIKKSGWTGIAFKITQKDDKTVIKYWPMAPSAFVRMLQLGIIPLLILYATAWKKIQNEIATFIGTVQELK